jgi:hypothetical protein
MKTIDWEKAREICIAILAIGGIALGFAIYIYVGIKFVF